ncbi:MAG: ribosomal-processing cysteine protease Prp [Clostridia bacterium]|nr:ribosomal-processing cysteine protease Prp [Clostridia bacterium]
MTKLVFFRTGGVFYGFEEQGHTGYGEEGNDILCAALSAMTMLIINTVEVAYSSSIDFTIDEETTNIKVRSKAALPEYEEDELKRYAVSGIFLAYYKQIEDMLEEYYDYLDVSVVDRPYEDD